MGKFLGDIATDVYGVNTNSGAIQPLFPRSKFQFMCIWTVGGADGSVKSVPFTRIQSVSMPGHTSRVSPQNQYNKKRLIQTGIDYSPVQMRVYDDRSAIVESFLKSYSNYYYAGLMSNDATKFGDDLISDNFSGRADTSETGFRISGNRYYLKDLRIIRINTAEDCNEITLRNPMISQIDGDTLDYSDSQAVSYTLQIQYEGYDIRTGNSGAIKGEVADILDAGTWR